MKAKRFIKIFVIFSFVLIPIVAYILFSIHSRNLFHAAVAKGDLDTLKSMLARQPKLDKKGSYALITAAILDNNDVARLLIYNGAQVNVQNEGRLTTGYTPLHWAAYKGNENLVDLLTANGAQVNIQSKDGQTPLHMAAGKGRYEVVKLLIDIGANVNATTKEGKFTPLHDAAYDGHKDVAKLLASSGANVLMRNDRGETPLLVATGRGHIDVAWVLIPYYERYGDFSRLKKTIYEGKLGQLKTAAELGFSTQVDTILQNYPEMINAKDENGNSLIKIAVWEGRKSVVEVLIAKGAETRVGQNGFTLLHLAIFRGHDDVGKVLIENGADVNAKSDKGDTPLHLAARYYRYADSHFRARIMARLLIENGAGVNTKNNNGETPMHGAALLGHADVVELLIAKGADVNAKDNQGQTPLQRARDQGRKEIVELLRDHGAKE